MAKLQPVGKNALDIFQRPSQLAAKYTFTWSIANFSKLNDVLRSPSFYPIPRSDIPFYVTLHLRTDAMDLLIHKMNEDDKPVRANFKTTLLSGLRNTCHNKTIKNFIFGKKLSCGLFSLTYESLSDNICIPQAISKILALPDDILTIKCTIDASASDSEVLFCNLERLSLDFKQMINDEKYSDSTLRIEDCVIRVHKCVLHTRSPVFAQILDSSFANSNITITSNRIPVVKALIYYLYTGMVEDLRWDVVAELYPLARFYGVYKLQKTCAAVLEAMLTVRNVCKVLMLANQENDIRLRMTAFKYIFTHFEEVSLSNEWNKILESNPILASSVLRFVTLNLATEQPSISDFDVSQI